jgi:cysteinyl-tRNA synthetase
MPLRLQNTLTRATEELRPAKPPEVTLYACGPTVYGQVHIGNWSAFLFYDVVVRWLRAKGYRVRFVSNLTDVDDRTIQRARQAGVGLREFTKQHAAAYLAARERLGLLPADHFPRATDYVDEMATMIQALLDKGHAYLADDGSIYYRVSSFPTYGALANLTRDSLKAGGSGRVRADDYEKEEVGDFALWKGWTPEDGEVAWEPTFRIDGVERVVKGRPGWHIECSAMSKALLGEQIDLHLGGEDLKFPHHQNEIAQSEGATGKQPFVRLWMHRRHLLVDGAKMSRRTGSFHTLEDVVAREGEGAARAFRYLVVSAHYGTPIDFTWAGLRAAAATLRNLTDARARFAKAAGGGVPASGGAAEKAKAAFTDAMDDDLNASAAMAAVHELVSATDKRLAAGTLDAGEAAATVALLDFADEALGLGLRPTRALTDEEKRLLDARAKARAAKDFAAADRLRDDLAKRGILVKDVKGGQEHSFA